MEVDILAAKVIVFAIQKGGASKTTSCAVTAYLLSQQGHKVLVVDADAQGNMTEIMTLCPIRDYRNDNIGGILEALENEGKTTRQNIVVLKDTLHLLIGSETLGVFPRTGYRGDIQMAVNTMLMPVQDDYDYILIDTAPALNYLLTSCLIASDGVVALFEAGKFCYSALLSFVETINYLKESEDSKNRNIKLLGILCSLIDNRRADNKDFLELVKKDEELGSYCFDTVITRKAATGRLAFTGFFENPEIKQATDLYKPFIKELLSRVNA